MDCDRDEVSMTVSYQKLLFSGLSLISDHPVVIFRLGLMLLKYVGDE